MGASPRPLAAEGESERSDYLDNAGTTRGAAGKTVFSLDCASSEELALDGIVEFAAQPDADIAGVGVFGVLAASGDSESDGSDVSEFVWLPKWVTAEGVLELPVRRLGPRRWGGEEGVEDELADGAVGCDEGFEETELDGVDAGALIAVRLEYDGEGAGSREVVISRDKERTKFDGWSGEAFWKESTGVIVSSKGTE